MSHPILYTDEGVTAARAGDRINLALDRGADLALGPELADPAASYAKAAGTSPFPIATGMSLVEGQAYLVEFDKSAHSGAATGLSLGGAAVSGHLDDAGTDRRVSVILLAGGSGSSEAGGSDQLCIIGTAATMTIRNPSVRAIGGSHAAQPAAAQQPLVVEHVDGFSALRFDLSDDALQVTYPAGQAGDLITFGRDASWIERNVSVEPGASLSVVSGGDTPVTTGIAHMLGDVVGRYHASRKLTAQERLQVLGYFQRRGAGGFLPSLDASLTGITTDSTQHKVGDLE
ncbi:hypothetical protein [Limimaricola cinnabarinus]|uniref:hypothetical protein n=1 Tax=Limimaricola cinnabarinus TaxID=1125964 RepID=UPI002FDFADC1